ncbi:inosine triphosphate pyrophosphatase-like protein [Cokeromyces recurvatus]|uniref:inosine triphosphate pyrophosphatase-like protein n=1 Tax=Cokeromyces recurvatus TaxID=90255 RepID=UPI00221FB6B2|nr:inosine triphosphate pyrophosphatase-like protein [Cokeromyces recurvatus]KAI7897633.1 inosine triphosphate pyrophosphatase-like protein [Cokeromyces recurvatus]
MPLPILETLCNKTIVLASASPRRREILTDMGLKFSVVTTLKPDENDPTAYETRSEYVADTAYMKAKEVFDRCQEDPQLPNADIVIGADTIVVAAAAAETDIVLEKPRDKEHALYMLDLLNGKTHHVLTGVQLFYKYKNKVERTGFVERTEVTFSKLDSDIINSYIDSGEPFDKAGGYGIQGEASLFVESIHGDYWNVVIGYLAVNKYTSYSC